MRLYRSIGDEELMLLIQGAEIEGKYHSFNEREHIIKTNTVESIGDVVCFFTDRIRWKDARHSLFLELEIPNEELSFGTGIYYAAKTLEKTKTWSGRWGSVRYEFQEAYAKKYNSSHVCALYTGGKYANWFMEKHVLPWVKDNGIFMLERF